ncbi:MAG: rod shape-determining protein MreC, partial [Flavobacteriales bacterium]
MQQIINFVIRHKNFLLFLFLLMLSLAFTIQSHSYHQSRFFNSANWITGNIYEAKQNITAYFDLSEENEQLIDENQRLRKLLFNKSNSDTISLDSTQLLYTVTTARVIKNSYSESR